MTLKKIILPLLLLLFLVETTSAATFAEQNGITWTFNGDYPTGQFANGDWWVVGPVTITSITPASTDRGGGSIMNGAMVNPDPELEQRQGYDGGLNATTYVESLNAARCGNGPVSGGCPLQLNIHESLSSVVSNPGAGSWCQFNTAAILTVLPSAPNDTVGGQSNYFRPPYSGTDKTLLYHKDTVIANMGLLQNLEITQEMETELVNRTHHWMYDSKTWVQNADQAIEAFEEEFDYPWLSHIPEYWGSQAVPHHTIISNCLGYGRHYSTKSGEAVLLLNLDYTNAQKEDLLVDFTQLGIDLYGVLENGGYWYAHGGHNAGRKLPILFAGTMLNDADMQNIGYYYDHSTFERRVRFNEDVAHFYIEETSPGVYNYEYGGYDASDVGLPEWGNAHRKTPALSSYPVDPTWDVKQFDGDCYRVSANGSSNAGVVLAAQAMGLKEIWNNDAFFDYQDRYMEIWDNHSNAAPGCGAGRRQWSPFLETAWDEHRDKFGGVWRMNNPSDIYSNGSLDFSQCQYNCSGGPECGNGNCEIGESCSSCSQDCGACPSCGDSTCNGTETCSNCQQDCGTCQISCGDGTCNGTETCTTCVQDCGTCTPSCGDGTCNGSENCSSCPGDCGVCTPSCGDGSCNGTESCSTCSQDCGTCGVGDYYVSTTGNDNGSGTQAQPWRTVQHAANNVSAGNTVVVLPGNYNENVTFSTNGSSGNMITFRSRDSRQASVRSIRLNGNYTRIEGFEINGTGGNSNGITIAGDNLEIVDNYLHNISNWGMRTTGNTVNQNQDDIYIAGNRIFDVQIGIRIQGDNWLVENNDFERMGYGGGEADYTRFFGHNIIIRNNHMHGTTRANVGDSHFDCFQTYPEQPTSNVLIEKNICTGFTTQCLIVNAAGNPNSHSDITAINNICAGPTEIAEQRGTGMECLNARNCVFANNVIAFKRWYGIWLTGVAEGGNSAIVNNILYSNDPWTPISGNAGTESNNLIDTSTANNAMFVDPFNYDFRLQEGSDAIDAGISTLQYGVSDDIEGTARPQGNTYDIGAYEFASGTGECVDLTTLLNHISSWKQGNLGMASLMQRLEAWKAGTGCSP